MRKYLVLLFLILWPSVAGAAINSGAIWEVRASGSDTNGGAFAIGVSQISSFSNLVVDATNNQKVTSSSYTFTSADVKRWIQVTAGTGWTTGYYQVSSVSGSAAILDRSPAPVGTTAGSFTIYKGLDYSQQNSANANGVTNGSSVNAVANGTTTITCADCIFSQDIVGNVVYFSGGSGSIAAQRRSVTAFTNSTTITIDTAIASSTGMTINIGGAVASIGEVLGSRGIASGNQVWWKNDGAFSASATMTAAGTVSLKGYFSTRGDLDNAVASANRPKLTYSGSGYAIVATTGFGYFRNFIVDDGSTAGSNGISTYGFVSNVTVKNYDGIGINLAGSASICYLCEATGGTANATKGIAVANGFEVYDSYVHDGNGVGIGATSTGAVIGNIVANMAGATSDCIQFSGPVNAAPIVIGNTANNCGRNGIFMGSATTAPHVAQNLLTNNAGYGFAISANSQASPMNDGNAYYNNTLGAKNNLDASLATNSNPLYTRANDIILSGNPFVNAAAGNFSLNNTAGAGAAVRDAGIPRAWPGSSTSGYPDFGAVTHQDTGSTVVINPNCAF